MRGRPQESEVASYYFTYIDQVEGNDPLLAIADQAESSLSFFRQIDENASTRRYAPDKWSIREVLNHITDTERAFSFRALWFARGFEDPLPSYDQNISAQGAQADSVSWQDHIDEFRTVRFATISLFKNMPPQAWMRTGTASGNPFTVRALAFIIAGHLTHHRRIISARYLQAL